MAALRIGDMLVAAGFVTPEQVTEALSAQRESGRRLGEEIVALGFATEVQIVQVLSNQLSVPWVSLHHIEMTRELLDLVPAELADRYGLIPVYRRVVRREGETLFVAMDDPTNEEAIQEVRRASGLPVKPMVAPPTDIRNAIRVYYLGMAPKAPEAPKRARRHTDEVAAVTRGAEGKPAKSAPASSEASAAPAVSSTPQAATPDAATARAPEPAVDAQAAPAAAKEAPAESGSASAPEPAPRGRSKGRFVTLTLLDGTTVRLPASRKSEDTTEARGGGMTGADLVRALLAKGQGAPVDDVLGGASWEVLLATLLQLMLKKGLVADWEFVEAYKKNLGQ